MSVVHLVGEIPDLVIQVAKAIKGQSACLKPVLATVFLDVPGNTMACGINVHKTGNYIDPQAEFIFVPAGLKPLPEGVEPFDIPGARYSHHRGHCTFYALLKEYKLKNLILSRIALIVDEADVIQEAAVEPVAPGLDFICRGLQRISRDDRQALEYGELVYEALYAELSIEPM